MTIFSNSRYRGTGSNIERIRDNAGASHTAVYATATPAVETLVYRVHTVKAGESLPSIAQALYGDPSLWWVIARFNTEFLDPYDISEGTTIRVPVV